VLGWYVLDCVDGLMEMNCRIDSTRVMPNIIAKCSFLILSLLEVSRAVWMEKGAG